MKFPLPLVLILAALSTSATVVTITDSVLYPKVKRLGINLGSRDRWGASQILKNVIDNPGFEPGVYGMAAHAADGMTGQTYPQDFWSVSWNNDLYGIGQPAGFWDNADYEIVYGPAKGRSGRIASFYHADDKYTYDLGENGTVPQKWDVMFLRKDLKGFYGDTVHGDTTETRPGSPGRQSLRLVNGSNSFNFYMDSYYRDGDTTCGKLFPIRGGWHLEFWAKGKAAGDQLRVRFFREGEANFFDETFALTTSWQSFSRDFSVLSTADQVKPYPAGQYRPIVGFSLAADAAGDEVWVDDLLLDRSGQSNPTVFCDALVNRLKELRPGVLRDWSNQLGNTVENQITSLWERRTNGYRPHERVAGSFGYSLHEFLELCREVNSEPWYVVPPTISASDMAGLMEYLSGPADGSHPYADKRAALGQTAPWTDVFPRIHLEFGNELWGGASGGDPFFGASLLGGTRLGAIASDRFAFLKASPYYSADKINLIIGGQAGYSGRQREIEQASVNHDNIALAPYFGVLDSFSTDEQIFPPLFAAPFYQARAGSMYQSKGYIDAEHKGTSLSIYEINFHTTSGPSPAGIRNDYLTCQAGGVALPLTMLLYQRDLGVIEQCAFSMLQYSFKMADGAYARLWGMLRDLEATGRKRPTFLGVEAVNKSIFGSSVRVTASGDNPSWTQRPINGVGASTDVGYIQSFACRDNDSTGLSLFNLHLSETLSVSLDLPRTPLPSCRLYRLASNSIHDDNEDAESVFIDSSVLSSFSGNYTLALPPHSLTVLVWKDSGGTARESAAFVTKNLAVRIPSPFSPGSRIACEGVAGDLRIALFDLSGRRVVSLSPVVSNHGASAFSWDGRAMDGRPAAAGVYFLVVKSGKQIMRQKVVLAR